MSGLPSAKIQSRPSFMERKGGDKCHLPFCMKHKKMQREDHPLSHPCIRNRFKEAHVCFKGAHEHSCSTGEPQGAAPLPPPSCHPTDPGLASQRAHRGRTAVGKRGGLPSLLAAKGPRRLECRVKVPAIQQNSGESRAETPSPAGLTGRSSPGQSLTSREGRVGWRGGPGWKLWGQVSARGPSPTAGAVWVFLTALLRYN